VANVEIDNQLDRDSPKWPTGRWTLGWSTCRPRISASMAKRSATAVAHVLMPEEKSARGSRGAEPTGPRRRADHRPGTGAFPERIKVEQAFADAGVALRLVGEGTAAVFVAEMVRQRVGLALLNPFPLTLGGLRGLVARRFAPAIAYRTMLLYPSAALGRAGGAPLCRSTDRDAAGGRPDHADQVALRTP
jgi:hypothetical protein